MSSRTLTRRELIKTAAAAAAAGTSLPDRPPTQPDILLAHANENHRGDRRPVRRL